MGSTYRGGQYREAKARIQRRQYLTGELNIKTEPSKVQLREMLARAIENTPALKKKPENN